MSAAALRLARLVAGSDNLPDAHAHAERVIAEHSRHVVRLRVKAPPATQKPSRKEVVGQIREAVMQRAAERCEWCGRDGFVLELHHLVSGGLRRHRESVETCAGICADCHRAAHRSDLGTLRAAKAWALRHGFREALAAVEKRIDHIEDVRRGR